MYWQIIQNVAKQDIPIETLIKSLESTHPEAKAINKTIYTKT